MWMYIWENYIECSVDRWRDGEYKRKVKGYVR